MQTDTNYPFIRSLGSAIKLYCKEWLAVCIAYSCLLIYFTISIGIQLGPNTLGYAHEAAGKLISPAFWRENFFLVVFLISLVHNVVFVTLTILPIYLAQSFLIRHILKRQYGLPVDGFKIIPILKLSAGLSLPFYLLLTSLGIFTAYSYVNELHAPKITMEYIHLIHVSLAALAVLLGSALFLSFPIMICENQNCRSSIRSSIQLMKDHFWKVALYKLLAYPIPFILTGIALSLGFFEEDQFLRNLPPLAVGCLFLVYPAFLMSALYRHTSLQKNPHLIGETVAKVFD